jgi:gliding motility-associated-like protein
VSFASSGVCQGSGNAVYFNGSSFIDLDTNHMILSFPVSFTYWIKRANLSNIERVFSTNNGAGGYSGFHSQILPNGTIEVFFGDGGGFAVFNRRSTYSNTPQSFSEWVHCAFVVHSPSSASIYSNGVLLGTYTAGSGGSLYQNPSGTGALGRLLTNLGWDYMIGSLDDFTVWDKALNSTEVRDLVCRRISPSKPQLLGYYNFDNQVANQIFDISPNGYVGTLVGSITTQTSGAAIGDTSYYQYANSSTGSVSSLSVILTSAQMVNVTNISPSVPGIQIYEVFSLPNSVAGIPSQLLSSQYFGVYLTRIDSNSRVFTLEVQNYNTNMQVFMRSGNDSPTWSSINPTSVIGSTASFNITSHMAEFMIAELDSCSLELGKDTSVCLPFSLWLKDRFYDLSKSYQWSTGSNADSIMVSSPGTYFVTMDSAGCIKNDTIIVAQNNDMLNPISTSETICDGDIYTVQIPQLPNQNITWYDGSNALTRTFSSTGSYWVTRTAPCDTLTDTISITVINCDTIPPPPPDTISRIFVPNVFTPNNDGINDFFLIQGTGINDYHIAIFNRWGTLLYESKNMSEAWDGTSNGTDIVEGVYTYLITYRTWNDKYREEYGHVTVFR